ncbi:hypothetical protein GQ44DRAFT_638537, partial [Phaeosphaeriaceae sp. PMI808]
EYTISYLYEIFKYKARSTITKILSLEIYIAKITTYLRRTKPYLTSLVVSTIELRITNLAKP